ncbi:MAG: glycosyltransferase family 4 protein [bacterium]|nr:glycosyltransferase family 4 protein [bacterium]
MRIVLVTICYPPEIRSISNMVREFAEELVQRGHAVTVLTGWPQYNLSEEDRQRVFITDSVENGVRVLRIKTLPTHKVPYIIRGIGQVFLPFLFLRAFKKYVRDSVDAVVVYSPHLPLTKVGTAIKKQYGARYILNIQDIFPQNAIDLGVLKNKMLIRYFEDMERRAYAAADVVTTCTENARQFLTTRKGLSEAKVMCVPNWIDIRQYARAGARGVYRKKYNLGNRFVLLFPGIFGPSQGLDFVIEVARRVADLTDICFLFVGDGTEKEKIQALTKKYHCANVQFELFVSLHEFPRLLQDADVGLLALKHDSGTPTVPGKFFGFLAARLPVLGFLNKESEGHRLIQESGCGYSCLSDDVGQAEALVRTMYGKRGQLSDFGEKGFAYVQKHFSKKGCIDKLEKLLHS